MIAIEREITHADRSDLPGLIGEIARLQAIATARRSGGREPPQPVREPPKGLERCLTVAEVADRLGVSKNWCYEHQEELGAVKLSRRAVRFPERRVMRYLAVRRAS